jgi:hypothetical protein
MVKTLTARTVTLRDLIEQLGLQLASDPTVFPEWQADWRDLEPAEKQFLDRIREGYFNLLNNPPFLERSVQTAILGPLLFLAGFYLPPFHLQSEQSITISATEDDILIQGQLDLLVLKDQFWVLVIESKQASFSLEAGLPQLLSYMLAHPHPQRPGFGLLTNGGSFMFVKTFQNQGWRYATSKVFELRNPGNDLVEVFQIMKHLGQLA